MQVQHEAQLLEPVTLRGEEFAPSENNDSLDTYTLFQNNLSSIEHLVCTSKLGGSTLIAAYLNNSKQVILIDTKSSAKRERFPLKSCDKKFSKQSFEARAIAFSPDGSRLAVGQTDCIIYIYRLPDYCLQDTGADSATSSNSRPTITGKFVCSSPVSCLIWVEIGIIFGTQDGKIKLISLTSIKSTSDSAQTNQPAAPSAPSGTKVINVHNSPKGVMPIALAFRSNLLAVSFIDGTVFLTTLSADFASNTLDPNSLSSSSDISSRRSSSLANHHHLIELSCPTYHLAIMQTNTLCCAGSDGKISLYSCSSSTGSDSISMNSNSKPSWMQNFELKEDITAVDYSAINEILAISTSTRLMFLKCDLESNSWQLQSSHIELANSIAPTSLAWTKDGCQLIVGTCEGSLQVFRCTWNKQHSISEQLDICHIARNRVRITDRSRNLLATFKTQHDIKRVNLLDNGQSVIIWTTNSLLLARLENQLQSELRWSWRHERSVKFCFDHQEYVLVHNISTRELVLVKLGKDLPIHQVKLDSVSKSRLCVRQYPPSGSSTDCSSLSSSFKSASTSKTTFTSSPISHQKLTTRSNSQQSQGESANSSQGAQETITEVALENAIRERFAYVNNDQLSLTVANLQTGNDELNISHKKPIIWLSLSNTVKKLVYRDTDERLFLVDLEQHAKKANNNNSRLPSTLALSESCTFAAWLPDSDILVAQSSHRIQIWYSLEDVRKVDEVYDSRNYNITGKKPLVDLSLTSKSTGPFPVITSVSSNFLELSNSYKVQLNELKVRFYADIHRGQLWAAKQLLERGEDDEASGDQPHINHLWSKLGWLAIERNSCDIAIIVFKKIGFRSMVSYLERCKEEPGQLIWRMAMLEGDWSTFEEELEPEQVVAVYKRMAKWSRAMDYLSQKQQFRQRDLVEQEFKDWLVSKGRLTEAALLQSKSGDLSGALDLLISNQKYEDAANLLISERKNTLIGGLQSNLVDQTKTLLDELIKSEKFLSAAKVAHLILNRQNQALDLYLKAEAYDLALELARLSNVDEQKLAAIEEQFAHHLLEKHEKGRLSRRRALPAINHYIAAQQYLQAARAAFELGDFARALDALKLQRESSTANLITEDEKQLAKSIGDHFVRLEGDGHKKAIEAYLLGGFREQVFELHVEQADFKKAFEVALQMHSNDRSLAEDQFAKLAQRYVASGELQSAENIYLLLERPEAAIELQRDAANYDRYLELVGEYQADQLESSLLMLAKEQEAAGEFEAAERYLLRASDDEWANVVRMYRLAGRWQDAYRVAREHCASEREPLLVQLAYWWCKSLPDRNSAAELLKRLQVHDLVVEFCCESKNFQLAIDLSEPSGDKELASSLVRRYAAYLEEQRRFDKAEEILLGHNQLESAVRMYIDNDMHSEAIRVVEERLKNQEEPGSNDRDEGTGERAASRSQQLVDLLNRTLVQCADRLAEEVGFSSQKAGSAQSLTGKADGAPGELLAAQQLYLRAQRPDLAVKMYKERGRWQEAVQVAQRFAPQLLESVERALDDELAEGLAPIVAEAGAARLERIHLSRTSSHSSLISGSSAAASSDQMAGIGSGKVKPDYLRNRVETKLLNGDSRATKQALGEFMESLVIGGPQGGLIGDLLDQIESLAASDKMTNRAAKLIDLANAVIEQSAWNGQIPSSVQLNCWFRLRNLLAAYLSMNRYRQDGGLQDQQVQQLEGRMLLAHYINLQGRLLMELEKNLATSGRQESRLQINNLTPAKVERLRAQLSGNQNCREIVDLIAKLSLSLLRYSDLLDPSAVLLSSGTWLLASGRRESAQFVWRRLLEIADGIAISESALQELQRAGIPPLVDQKTNWQEGSSAISAIHLSAIREWLLEALIESRVEPERPALADLFQASRLCLICGLSTPVNDLLTMGDYQVCGAEWLRLKKLGKQMDTERRGRRRGSGSTIELVPLTELVAINLTINRGDIG